MSVPTQQRAQKSGVMVITKTIDTKIAEKQARLERAAGGSVVIAKSGASAPVTDRQLVVSEAVSQKLRVHRETRALAGPSAGFASYRTKSGNSFGSLKGLIDKWNDADDEVTSTATSLGPTVGIAERKLEQAFSALAEAKAASKVCFGAYTYPSPRDLGRTSNVRPESSINFFFLPKHAYQPFSPRVSTANHFLRFIHFLRVITDTFCLCTQHTLKLRTGYFQTLLEENRLLKRDFSKMKSGLAHNYNQLMEEKKSLEARVSELTGKPIFQIPNRTIFPFGLIFASELPFYSDRC